MPTKAELEAKVEELEEHLGSLLVQDRAFEREKFEFNKAASKRQHDSEQARQKLERRRMWLAGIGVPIVIAGVTLFLNNQASQKKDFDSLLLAEQIKSQQELARQRQEFEILKEALQASDPEKALANVKFFADIGLLPPRIGDEIQKITDLRKSEQVPSLPNSE